MANKKKAPPKAPKVKSYTVILSVKVFLSAGVVVQASSLDEAEEKAINEVMTSRRYYASDFDGNHVHFDESDIELLDIDPEE